MKTQHRLLDDSVLTTIEKAVYGYYAKALTEYEDGAVIWNCRLDNWSETSEAFRDPNAVAILTGEAIERAHKYTVVTKQKVWRPTAHAVHQTKRRLDESIEAEKERNDFLKGVPAIVKGLRSGKIACRVYRQEKFHAKAYITHGRMEVVGAAALVGSSNLSYPGLTENMELNVQITGRPARILAQINLVTVSRRNPTQVHDLAISGPPTGTAPRYPNDRSPRPCAGYDGCGS